MQEGACHQDVPENIIVWGWYPLREDNETAHLTLSRKAELLWIENPDKTRRQGFTLGPMERKLVQITDRVTVIAGSPPPKTVAKEAIHGDPQRAARND